MVARHDNVGQQRLGALETGIASTQDGDANGTLPADSITGNTVTNGGAGSVGISVFIPTVPTTVSGNIVTDVPTGMEFIQSLLPGAL